MQYSRSNRLFVLPQFNSAPFVILPPSKLQEILAKPDDQVDPFIINGETLAQEYSLGHRFVHGPHIEVVKRQLTRKLPTLTTDVYDELVKAMQNEWPASKDEWTTVKAYETSMKIVSRAANRVFSGTKLCRTPEYLEHSRLYAISVFKMGGLMRLFPRFMQPVVAPFFQREVRKHREICKKIAMPEIHDRLDFLLGKSKAPNYQEPNDALQWLLRDSIELAKNDPFELEDDTIIQRLLILNMVAIHTTSMVTTNVLLDLYSSPDSEEYLAGLREECEKVLAEHGGIWSKEAVNKLVRIDSTIRESMRISSLADLSLKRLIVDPKGVTLSDGTYLPYGVRVCFASHAIQTDSSAYPDRPDEWDAFRFSRPREEYQARVEAGADPEHLRKVLEQKNTALIATGGDWLSFGHGRHACPGRFFASQEMKLMLAHIVMNYDIAIEGGRPKNMAINGSSIPSSTAEMKIRLR